MAQLLCCLLNLLHILCSTPLQLHAFFTCSSSMGQVMAHQSIFFVPVIITSWNPLVNGFLHCWTVTCYSKGKYFLCGRRQQLLSPPCCGSFCAAAVGREETATSCMRALSAPSPPSSSQHMRKNYLLLSLLAFFLLCIAKLPKLPSLNNSCLSLSKRSSPEISVLLRQIFFPSFWLFHVLFLLLFPSAAITKWNTRKIVYYYYIHQKYSKEDNTSLMSLQLVPHLHSPR